MSKAATTTTWAIPAQTAAKHRLLRAYLHRWFPKMSWAGRLVYLDGFAGPGRYSNGEDGSPLVALGALLDHQHFSRWSGAGGQYTFAFCEQDSARAQNLKTEVDAFFQTRGGQPSNVSVIIRPQTFEAAGNDLLEQLARQGNATLAPTLALIDPFGFSGLPMKLIARLVSFPRCEVLVNFMIEYVNRFATARNTPAGVTAHLEDLFGCSDFSGAPPAGDPLRRPYLLDLYRQQLRSVAGLKYLRAFEMVNDRGRNVYDLVYGTGHPAGLDAIKAAMWTVDPEEGRRFSAADADALNLFSGTPNLAPLRAQLRQRFSGQEVTIEKIEEFVLIDTDYLPKSHLKRATLIPMEDSGELQVTTVRRRPRTFPEGCRIRFS